MVHGPAVRSKGRTSSPPRLRLSSRSHSRPCQERKEKVSIVTGPGWGADVVSAGGVLHLAVLQPNTGCSPNCWPSLDPRSRRTRCLRLDRAVVQRRLAPLASAFRTRHTSAADAPPISSSACFGLYIGFFRAARSITWSGQILSSRPPARSRSLRGPFESAATHAIAESSVTASITPILCSVPCCQISTSAPGSLCQSSNLMNFICSHLLCARATDPGGLAIWIRQATLGGF